MAWNKERVYRKLADVLGEEWISDDEFVRFAYSYDMSFVEPKMPDIVVLPETVEEVQEIMKIANEEKVPVVPFTGGTNIGGLCIPEKGGIILDLKRMNRIIEINEEMRYAVIEPGVSHAQLAEALYKKGLQFGWPVGPPSASVLACAINHGIGHLTGRYGLNSQMLTSMEVVLPTGELVRLGSAGITGSWHALYPVPRLDGLFIGMLGTTGVVTKLGINVWAIPDYRDVLTVSANNIEDMTSYMIRWGRFEAADDLTAVSWWLAQIPIPYPYKPKPDDEPEWFSYSVISGYTEKELEAKREMWEIALKKEQENGSSVREYDYPEEAKRARTQLPSQIVGSTKNYAKSAGGGISWPGTFTPAPKWPEAFNRWKEIYIRRGLSPSVRVTLYRGTHYGMLRAMTPFDKRDPEKIKNAKEAIVEALQVALDVGGIPYKPPIEFLEEVYKRADPGYVELMKRVKDMLDPNNIMNPGKLLVR